MLIRSGLAGTGWACCMWWDLRGGDSNDDSEWLCDTLGHGELSMSTVRRMEVVG